MARTFRKIKDTNERFVEGQIPRTSTYICRCSYCTGVDKNELKDSIAKKEMLKQIQEYNTNG